MNSEDKEVFDASLIIDGVVANHVNLELNCRFSSLISFSLTTGAGGGGGAEEAEEERDDKERKETEALE